MREDIVPMPALGPGEDGQSNPVKADATHPNGASADRRFPYPRRGVKRIERSARARLYSRCSVWL